MTTAWTKSPLRYLLAFCLILTQTAQAYTLPSFLPSSTISAANNLNLIATGGGANSNITIQGSDISAKQDITLTADNKINLLADKNVNDQVSHNSSSSSGAGVGITVGSGGGSFGITANASLARGNIDGTDTTYSNTHVTAGNALKIKSGGDTNMIGATATGQQVIADIGGDLNIASLQDTSTYDTKQQSASGSATVGVGGASANLSLNQSTINGTFASVQEQSGLKAGDGGFQIKVNGNTDLKGAVIESSQAAVEAGNNTLSTATLTSSDIDNASEYKAQSISISGGTGGISAPMALQASDKDTSTTRSGISGGSVVITDDAKQKQLTGQDSQETVASLNRDVTTGQDTSGAISNNLDVDQVQGAMAVTQAFVQQANTLVADLATKSDRLKAAGDAKQAAAKEEKDPAKKAQYQAEADSLYQQSADSKADSDQWAPGSTYRTIATAITAAAGGNVTGGTSQLAQGAAVNYIQSLGATEVKKIADSLKDANGNNTPESESLRAALHGIVACAGASAQGSDCSSGALGASAGSALNSILQGDTSKMTAMEKENRKNLVATLVAGIAASTDARNVATATNSVVMETENNYLLQEPVAVPQKSEAQRYADAKAACGPENAAACAEKKTLEKLSSERDSFVMKVCKDNDPGCRTELYTALDNGASIKHAKGGSLIVTSPEYPSLVNSDPQGDVIANSMDNRLAGNLSQSLPALAIVAGPELVAAAGAGKAATGTLLGMGFDAAGQVWQGDSYRPLQTVVAGITGGVAYPMAGGSLLGNAIAGGAANATNAAVTNAIYDRNDSVLWAAGLGVTFGASGKYFGSWGQDLASSRLPTSVGATYIDSSVPLFQQTINLGIKNPNPERIGTGLGNAIGAIPSFISLPQGNSK